MQPTHQHLEGLGEALGQPEGEAELQRSADAEEALPPASVLAQGEHGPQTLHVRFGAGAVIRRKGDVGAGEGDHRIVP